MYAVIADTKRAEEDEKRRATKRGDQRPKLGLVSVKRLELPRKWFVTLFKDPDKLALRTEQLEERLPDFAIVTDASPQGMGALLATVDHNVVRFTILEALEVPVLEEDAKWLLERVGIARTSGGLGGQAGLPTVGQSPGGQECHPEERQRGGIGYDQEVVIPVASDQLVGR